MQKKANGDLGLAKHAYLCMQRELVLKWLYAHGHIPYVPTWMVCNDVVAILWETKHYLLPPSPSSSPTASISLSQGRLTTVSDASDVGHLPLCIVWCLWSPRCFVRPCPFTLHKGMWMIATLLPLGVVKALEKARGKCQATLLGRKFCSVPMKVVVQLCNYTSCCTMRVVIPLHSIPNMQANVEDGNKQRWSSMLCINLQLWWLTTCR